MNAQGLDAQGKEDQVEESDGGAASPLQHGVSFCCGEIDPETNNPCVISGPHFGKHISISEQPLQDNYGNVVETRRRYYKWPKN